LKGSEENSKIEYRFTDLSWKLDESVKNLPEVCSRRFSVIGIMEILCHKKEKYEEYFGFICILS